MSATLLFFASHRQDYPDPRYYLSFTQVNFSCFISRVSTTQVLAWASGQFSIAFRSPPNFARLYVCRGRRNSRQKYFFRNAALRHLRVEQFNRYCYMAGEGDTQAAGTMEDTIPSDEEPAPPDLSHRNYDEVMEETPPGAHFLASFSHVPGCKRRVQTRLGCSRVPFIEPTVRGKCRTTLVAALGGRSAPAAS